jgi:hypothetical protein
LNISHGSRPPRALQVSIKKAEKIRGEKFKQSNTFDFSKEKTLLFRIVRASTEKHIPLGLIQCVYPFPKG